MERLIGRYGKFGAAKTFVIFAGIHGNEKAGIHALNQLFQELKEWNVEMDATVIGIVGNVKALEQSTRFIHKDLNRQWYLSKIRKLGALPYGMLNTSEDREQKQILDLIQNILNDKGTALMLIDLHTTSAKGGCFTITNSQKRSSELALNIPVPVIDGMTNKISGTTLEYFDQLGLPAIAFEAGQHIEPEAVFRIKAALVSIFCNSGCLDPQIMDHYQESYNKMKKEYMHLPNHVNVLYRHPVEEEDDFVMKEGFSNFDKISNGDLLARDAHGEIRSHLNGLILMPLYQKKGSDGFFIVEEVK